MKALIFLFCFAVLTAQAQSNTERSSRERTESTANETTVQASEVQSSTARKPARKTHRAQGAAGSISTQPGTVATLCCGSLDPHSMAGKNCAYMHTGQGCGGYILACPDGTSETVKKDGGGYCKKDG